MDQCSDVPPLCYCLQAKLVLTTEPAVLMNVFSLSSPATTLNDLSCIFLVQFVVEVLAQVVATVSTSFLELVIGLLCQ